MRTRPSLWVIVGMLLPAAIVFIVYYATIIK